MALLSGPQPVYIPEPWRLKYRCKADCSSPFGKRGHKRKDHRNATTTRSSPTARGSEGPARKCPEDLGSILPVLCLNLKLSEVAY